MTTANKQPTARQRFASTYSYLRANMRRTQRSWDALYKGFDNNAELFWEMRDAGFYAMEKNDDSLALRKAGAVVVAAKNKGNEFLAMFGIVSAADHLANARHTTPL